MTCCFSHACRPVLIYWFEGKPYCAVHYAMMKEPRYFEQENVWANPPVIGYDEHPGSCARRDLRFG